MRETDRERMRMKERENLNAVHLSNQSTKFNISVYNETHHESSICRIFNMPQEFLVSRCAECETFCVQIVKKSSKWQCPICGLKQELLRAYARSNKALECRKIAQAYNRAREKADNDLLELKLLQGEKTEESNGEQDDCCPHRSSFFANEALPASSIAPNAAFQYSKHSSLQTGRLARDKGMEKEEEEPIARSTVSKWNAYVLDDAVCLHLCFNLS